MIKVKYFPTLLVSSTIFFSSYVNAIPEIWYSGFGQGFQNYSIYNENNEINFALNCNTSYINDKESIYSADHSLTLSIKNENHKPKQDDKLEILINGSVFMFMYDEAHENYIVDTSYRNNANDWTEFVDELSLATKIEFYINDQKIGELNPRKESLKKLYGIQSTCKAIFYQEFSN